MFPWYPSVQSINECTTEILVEEVGNKTKAQKNEKCLDFCSIKKKFAQNENMKNKNNMKNIQKYEK